MAFVLALHTYDLGLDTAGLVNIPANGKGKYYRDWEHFGHVDKSIDSRVSAWRLFQHSRSPVAAAVALELVSARRH